MKRTLQIQTADGTAEASLFTPDGRGTPTTGIIFYMDAFGLRPALDEMATRMAGLGHTVLVPDLFYRKAPYGPFDAKTAFGNDTSRAAIMAMLGGTTHAMTIADTRFFLDALSQAGATGHVATTGYCFGGGRALMAAATYSERVVAAASFHGGNLAPDGQDGPHARAADIKARVYVGSAGVDRSFPPEQSARLEQALRAAEVDFIMENYVGMEHGWTVPDSAAFNSAGAERHWARLTALLAETLA